MLVLFWIILRFAFLAGIIFLMIYNIQTPPLKKQMLAFKNLFLKTSQKPSPTIEQNKLPVELYIWVPPENHYCCNDCLERSTWNPMDIADWMQKGLPRTSEAQTQCQKNCTCQLMLIHPNKHSHFS